MPLDEFKRRVERPDGRFVCYECTLCDMCSTSSGALSRHIMAKHPEAIKESIKSKSKRIDNP